MNRNWTRATAVVARGDGEEYRGWRVGPLGRRRLAGGELWRRQRKVDDAATVRERIGEGGEGQEQQELTRNLGEGSARPEEAGVDGKMLGGAAARAEGRRRSRPAEGLPARAGCPGR